MLSADMPTFPALRPPSIFIFCFPPFQLPEVNCPLKILNGKFQKKKSGFKLHTILSSMMKSCAAPLSCVGSTSISIICFWHPNTNTHSSVIQDHLKQTDDPPSYCQASSHLTLQCLRHSPHFISAHTISQHHKEDKDSTLRYFERDHSHVTFITV